MREVMRSRAGLASVTTALLVVLLLTGQVTTLAGAPVGALATPAAGGMDGMETAGPLPPPVTGYAAGEEILFIHTEASDPEIAAALTDMMGGSPVLVVPALAEAPASMLGKVYVFTNGIMPAGAMGPLGFQPDVFDSPPGQDGYSPLRDVQWVTWDEAATPRLLTSASAVAAAAEQGELALKTSGIVVNMPFLSWPGGQR